MSASWALLITCEHGGNAVPGDYAPLFADWRDALASHRGHDLGALATARVLARAVDAPLFFATTSRMLVDLNRSVGHPGLFSEATKGLPRREKAAILDRYYHPHRQAVTEQVAAGLAAGKTVLHIASHSFTPRLRGVTRHCDVGFLYDPGRAAEKAFCRRWLRELACLDADLILRRNYPYKGVSDGLATALRRRFGERYLGVELEVNQRFALGGEEALFSVSEHLADALRRALGRAATCR
ncbi:MAG: N-formylglutamate amidohydrolase [Acidobacteriota bacterium]